MFCRVFKLSRLTALSALMAFSTPLWADSYYKPQGSVYVMTNSADLQHGGNAVVRFAIQPDRTLAERETVATGGRGAGPAPAPGGGSDPLGSQDSIVVDHGHRLLFAANPGSNNFTVFAIDNGRLRRLQVVPSGGSFPLSFAIRGNWVYVLNAGGDGNITGFYINRDRSVSAIPGSTRPLGVSERLADAPPAPVIGQSPNEVGFSPDGRFLIVTIKEIRGLGPIVDADGRHDGRILVFPMSRYGTPSPEPVTTLMNGVAPYGFTFDRRGYLVVSEFEGNDAAVANGDILKASAASTYLIRNNGTLGPISDSVPDFQGGSCWIRSSGRYVFVADTDTNAWTTYRIRADGTLSLTVPDGLTAAAPVDSLGRPADPLDFQISRDGSYIYSLQPGLGTVATWRIDRRTGNLAYVDEVKAFNPTLRSNDPADPTPRPTVAFQVIPNHDSPVGLAIYED